MMTETAPGRLERRSDLGPPGPAASKEALVILPGVTADGRKRAFLARYFRSCTDWDVFVPDLWQCLGLAFCARQLHRFLRREVESAGYDQVHFLCYISGGQVLRATIARWPFERWGRIVYVRSPLQEQVPGLLVARYGRLLTMLRAGRMVVDLADPKATLRPLPVTGRDQGLVLERGLSKLAESLGVRSEDFERLKSAGDFAIPGCRDVLVAAESHDDVYTSEPLLASVAGFLATGSFAPLDVVSAPRWVRRQG